jgi:two-component system, NarL family, sensor kinase
MKEYVIILACVTIFGVLFFVIYIFLVNQKRHNRELLDKQLTRNRLEKAFLEAQIKMHQKILDDISHQIHDTKNIVSELTLDINDMDLNNQESLPQIICDIKMRINEVMEGLKKTSRELNPEKVAEKGLLALIEDKLAWLGRHGKYKTRVIKYGTAHQLNAEQTSILFFMFNNVISNIIEHAAATSIIVQLSYFPSTLELEISDNGKGFDLQKKPGLGIADIMKQARLINATVEIQSTKAAGTTVKLNLPISDTGQYSIRQ